MEQLRKVADNQPWLLSSANALVEDLKHVKAESNMKMYRADVKEFFMSGTPAVLCEFTMEWFKDHPKRTAIEKVMQFLLN